MACRLSFVCVECRQTPQKNCDRCCQPIPKEVGVLSEAVTRVDARRVTSSVMGRGVERRVDDLLNPVTCDVDIIICSDLLHFAAFISGGVPDVLPNAFRLGDAFWRRTVPLSKQWESQASQ